MRIRDEESEESVEFLKKKITIPEGSEGRRRGRNDWVIIRSGVATCDHIEETENFLRILLTSRINDVDLDLLRIRGTRGSASKLTTTKSAEKWNIPTFTKTSSATPIGREIDRSANSRVIKDGKVTRDEKLSGLPQLFWLRALTGAATGSMIEATMGSEFGIGILVLTAGGGEDVVGIMGLLYAVPLQMVIPFKSSFRLVTVLLGRVPEPEDDASQLAVEESRPNEPELGNQVLDKLEVGFDHD
nr:hypothetical protein [Tanacetum cinerariifolium]